MLILSIKTNSTDSEVGLFDSSNKLAYKKWEAGRSLAETIHTEIKLLLDSVNKQWTDINGVIIYSGPGSFTGLRIGLSVAEAIAYSQNCLIVGSEGEDWIEDGVKRLTSGESDKNIKLNYGSEINISKPRK